LLPGAKVLRSKSSSIRQYDNINRASDMRELKTSGPQHVKTHVTSLFAFLHFIHVFAPQFRTIYFALYTLTNFALSHFRTSHFINALFHRLIPPHVLHLLEYAAGPTSGINAAFCIFASNDTIVGITSSGNEFHGLTILNRKLYFLTSSVDCSLHNFKQ